VKIAKPLLLIATPIGLAIGLYEGWRLAGGLVFIMAALMGVLGVAFLSVVLTIRREREQERRNAEQQPPPSFPRTRESSSEDGSPPPRG
jgi:predicted MFS family arabinose efflux permease